MKHNKNSDELVSVYWYTKTFYKADAFVMQPSEGKAGFVKN